MTVHESRLGEESLKKMKRAEALKGDSVAQQLLVTMVRVSAVTLSETKGLSGSGCCASPLSP
jgi:hypothetical protein